MDLGKRLNRARRRAGLPINELAARLNLSREVISEIVSGKRSPTPDIAKRLSDVLDLNELTEKELREIDISTYTSSALDKTMRLDRYGHTEG